MQEGSREVLQRLLYHAHPDDFDTFLKYFEEKERTILDRLPKRPEPIHLHIDNPHIALQTYHYSWFIKPLESCPEPVRKELLVVFSEQQQQKLSKLLKIKLSNKQPSEIVRKYFTHWFLKKLGYDLLPPSCFYTNSPFQALSTMNKNHLVRILHQLGIIEIANMAKRIVDKKTLKDLMHFFTPNQKNLFKEAQKKYNDPLPSMTKDLNKKLEDDRSFNHFLEKKGLLRLAKGLATESRFFVWNLAHILDLGRGQEFLSLIRKSTPNAHTPYYAKQVLELCQKSEKSEAS